MARVFCVLVMCLLLAAAVYYLLKWKKERSSGSGTTVVTPLGNQVTPPSPLPPIRPTVEVGSASTSDIWALVRLKPCDDWLGTRRDRLIRLVQDGDTLYIENVDGDEYVDRTRGGTLRATVHIVERGKRAVLVWAATLVVGDTIERAVRPAHESPTDSGLRGIVASDDAVRKLKLDIQAAEPLPEVE